MRKLLLSFAILLAFAALARAQAGNTVLLRFVGAPTGTCAPIMVAVNNATGEMFDCLSGAWNSVGGTGGGGTVTSVSFTGGLISVATPTTTPALTVAGTSGGIPYFSGATTWASSAALAANSPVLGGGAGVAPSTKTFLTTDGAAKLTVGIAGGGNGALALAGTTSGAATCTAPAIAGTVTNPVVCSNGLSLPVGTVAAPPYSFTGNTATGMLNISGQVLVTGGASGGAGWTAGSSLAGAGVPGSFFTLAVPLDSGTTSPMRMSSGGGYGWTASASDASAAADTSISRDAAGVVDFGTGAAGSTAGSWKATAGTLSGSLIVGGGTSITKVLSAAATLDFANLAAIGCEDLTITVTGAALSDSVALGIPNAAVVANGQFTAWVSATNTVTVRFCTLVSGDPASASFEATVFQN